VIVGTNISLAPAIGRHGSRSETRPRRRRAPAACSRPPAVPTRRARRRSPPHPRLAEAAGPVPPRAPAARSRGGLNRMSIGHVHPSIDGCPHCEMTSHQSGSCRTASTAAARGAAAPPPAAFRVNGAAVPYRCSTRWWGCHRSARQIHRQIGVHFLDLPHGVASCVTLSSSSLCSFRTALTSENAVPLSDKLTNTFSASSQVML